MKNVDKKKVLIVGSGAREHALAWKTKQSQRLRKLYVAPGNPGTAEIADNIAIEATDIKNLAKFADNNGIGLTIVGPDEPLALGIANEFQARGLPIFAPLQNAAEIESSKRFAKHLMVMNGIPTANFQAFHSFKSAFSHAEEHFAESSDRIVIKVSGLALGKGVYICHGLSEAEFALKEIMVKQTHGPAGNTVVIEDYIEGPEISIHALCDGYSYELFPAAQDYKRAFTGDKGLNTGGMGAVAPVPWFNQYDLVGKQIVEPTLAALKKIGRTFRGNLYPGLKITKNGPMVLEYNARLGDPETQVFMSLLKTDLIDVCEACIQGKLHEIDIEWHEGFAACVVIASGRYPIPGFETGFPISGIEQAKNIGGALVFHGGTKIQGDKLVTAGGRVLSIVGTGDTLKKALDVAYYAAQFIQFDGSYYRNDIGEHAMRGPVFV